MTITMIPRQMMARAKTKTKYRDISSSCSTATAQAIENALSVWEPEPNNPDGATTQGMKRLVTTTSEDRPTRVDTK